MSSGTIDLSSHDTSPEGELADQAAREEALNTTRSFIVQAPAGSGKTELLTRRFLALLGEVEEPEEVLAITFTRAATAEMRRRVIEALEAAREGAGRSSPLGERALRNAERRGWRLLEQPQRLNIQTIDALCQRIAHQAPLLSRLGGRLTPTENAVPLYSKAARRTLELLGGGEPGVSTALDEVLRLRDTSLADCERLIAAMLARRDQWLYLFPVQETAEADWAAVREALERPLADEHARVLGRAREIFERNPELAAEMLVLADYACGYDSQKVYHALRGLRAAEHLQTAEHWRCVCNLLLTEDDRLRRQLNKSHGFPTVRDGGRADMNSRLRIF